MRRILRVKFRAGLFEHPYVDVVEGASPAQLQPGRRRRRARGARAARWCCSRTSERRLLPFSKDKKTAVIGPLAKNGHDMLGPWWGKGRDEDAVTVFDGIKAQSTQPTTYAEGCSIADKEPPNNTPADECGSDAGFDAAVAAADAADQVVLALGESRGQSGEAASRSEIDLPGKQEELIERIKATGKPFVVVLFNGRPLTLGASSTTRRRSSRRGSRASQAGNAVADVLFGKVNPGGKLPVSFPRRVGQVPIYYNHEPTGRPCDVGVEVQLALPRPRELRAAVPVRLRPQLQQVRDLEPAAERVEGVLAREAHGLRRRDQRRRPEGRRGGAALPPRPGGEHLAAGPPAARVRARDARAGQKRTVTFTLDRSDFGFYDNRGRFVVEPGTIDVYAGNSSKADLKQSFLVTG